MTITPSTTSDITPLLSGFVLRTPLDVAEFVLPHLTYAMRGGVPKGSGSRWTARRFTKLTMTPATLQMTEGVTSSNNATAVTDVYTDLKQYGNYYVITDVMEQTEPVDVVAAYGPLLQLNIAETLDKVVQLIMVGGTTAFYANGVSSRGSVAQKFTTNDLDRIIAYLKTQGAKPVTEIVMPNGNIATSPVPKAYIMLVHPDVGRDLANLTGFVEAYKYANPGLAAAGELGNYRQIRVIEAPLTADSGTVDGATGSTVYKNNKNSTGKFDVYLCPVFGQNAYGAIDFSALVPTSNTGSSDTDPQAQRKAHGWKQMFNALRLNEGWIVRGEAAATL